MKGIIKSRGMYFCQACGELAQWGNEEFDWCDHVTGADCSNMPDAEDDGFDEDELGYDDFDDWTNDSDHPIDIELEKSHLEQWNEKVKKFNERNQQ